MCRVRGRGPRRVARPPALTPGGVAWYQPAMSILDESTIRSALADLDGWELRDNAIVRELRFDGFLDAIAFIDRLAPLAEAANHHPELFNVYSRVTVTLSTHDAGGVTQKDLDLARQIDGVVAG